ncbi:MAG: sensor histidine kinase [Firmicutes bacterium]|nr:sensor histidine kinase [Bacillota bacterium]
MLQRFSTELRKKSIFQKLLLAFAVVVIIPLTFSFYVAQRTASDLIVYQNMVETINSLALVANSIDALQQRAYSLAFYVSNDESIRSMLREDYDDFFNVYNLPEQELRLRLFNRTNRFSRILNNLSFNMMDVRSYLTVAATNNQRYINWPYTGYFSQSFMQYGGTGMLGIWTSFEKNYVTSERVRFPYVWTVGKNIFDPIDRAWLGTFVISIPERSIASLLSSDGSHNRIVLDESNMIIASTKEEWLDQCFSVIYAGSFIRGSSGFFQAVDENGAVILISHVATRNLEIIDIKYYNYIVSQINVVRINLFLLNILSVVVFVAVAAFIARSIHLDIIKRNLESEKEKRDAELKVLQAQITPHFLFNTLNSIRWAAINNHTKKAADMTLALSSLLRMTIINVDEFIAIETEVTNLQNYVAIFRMRQAIDFTFEVDMPEELMSYKIPKLLFQPIVENSLIHGFEGMTQGCKISIVGKKMEDGVYISIADNGVGMTDEQKDEKSRVPKFSGIGIGNVNQRIKLNFGEEYGLKIESVQGKGTVVRLHLPK